MPSTYNYSSQRDFPRGCVNVDRMTLETGTSPLASIFTSVNLVGDACVFTFSRALLNPERDTLGALILGHSGDPLRFGACVAILPMVGPATTITATSWADVGGTLVDRSYFPRETSRTAGKLIGQVQVSGVAAVLQMLRDGATAVLPSTAVADTGGGWSTLGLVIPFTAPVLPGANLYTLQAKVGALESAIFRHISLALIELI